MPNPFSDLTVIREGNTWATVEAAGLTSRSLRISPKIPYTLLHNGLTVSGATDTSPIYFNTSGNPFATPEAFAGSLAMYPTIGQVPLTTTSVIQIPLNTGLISFIASGNGLPTFSIFPAVPRRNDLVLGG